MWVFAGEWTHYALRLGGNLILTRLLFPEAFGLMSLVQVFLMGLEMFSDIGIVPSIIQNKQGDDPEFLNTAWTIQVGRGFLLWIFSCLIALPAANFYKEPMLGQLLPISGTTALIAGFKSTKLATANRKLTLGKLTILELGTYALGLLATISWAWISPSVWALVGGGIVTVLVETILSHLLLEGAPNRFCWNQEAFRSLQQFGRWIFVSTALTFLAGQGDRLLLGRLMDVHFLGIYTIAITLARLVNQLIMKLGDKVLFPSYSEIFRERPEELRSVLRKTRLGLIGAAWSASLFLIVFGDKLIGLLYDDRYKAAGWMLQLLSIDTLVGILALTYDNVLLALGKSFLITIFLIFQIAIQTCAMIFGSQLAGQQGVILGLSFLGWMLYPLKAIFLRRISIWQPEVDIPVILVAIPVASICLYRLIPAIRIAQLR